MLAHRVHRKIRHLALAGAAATAFTALVAPLLVRVPPLQDALPAEDLADADSQFIEINGLKVHLKTRGNGERSMLLLHGFGASLYSWHAVMDQLGAFSRVIAYDRTGFGLSAHPLEWQGANPYRPQAQVEQVIGLLDHFGVERAILVGNSHGGTVALRTALAHPERVAALVLVDPAVYVGVGAPWWLYPLLSTPQARHLAPLLVRRMVQRGPQLVNRAWHDPSTVTPETYELYKKSFRVQDWDRALIEFSLAGRIEGLPERLGELKLPVLVVSGEHDRIIPPRDSLRLAQELPNARLEVIANAGHVPQEECPEEFLRVVGDFIEQVDITPPQN